MYASNCDWFVGLVALTCLSEEVRGSRQCIKRDQRVTSSLLLHLRTPPIRPNTHTQTHTLTKNSLADIWGDRISNFVFLNVSLGWEFRFQFQQMRIRIVGF